MSIKEKIKNAKPESCLTDMFTNEEWEFQKTRSLIAAEIELARIDKEMDVKAFAEFMGVSPREIIKWEDGQYNFDIKTLSHIAYKLDRPIASFLTSDVNN